MRLINAVGISNKPAVNGQITEGLTKSEAQISFSVQLTGSRLSVRLIFQVWGKKKGRVAGPQPSQSITDQRDDSFKL